MFQYMKCDPPDENVYELFRKMQFMVPVGGAIGMSMSSRRDSNTIWLYLKMFSSFTVLSLFFFLQ